MSNHDNLSPTTGYEYVLDKVAKYGLPSGMEREGRTVEERASMFVTWCAKHGLGDGDRWPMAVYEQLIARIEQWDRSSQSSGATP